MIFEVIFLLGGMAKRKRSTNFSRVHSNQRISLKMNNIKNVLKISLLCLFSTFFKEYSQWDF